MKIRTDKRLSRIILASFLITVGLQCPASALEIHQQIQGPFSSSADVTAACLKCHQPQAVEVLQSTHWTWVRQREVNGKNTLYGKKDALTAFAIDVSSNSSRCMGCHVSNTRPNTDLNASGPEMVDCLVCHDTTRTYRQADPGKAGEYTREELEQMARNVGKPTPVNCTTCHFADCGLPASGQTGVTSPENKTPFQDIHINRSAVTVFTCQDCHTRSSGHSFTRKISRSNSSPEEGCASCHSTTPHLLEQLNRHGATIACQTCHIPQYAQIRPLVISWNWIMNGKANRVYQYQSHSRNPTQDENGFTSAMQMEPVYMWDDGSDQVYTRGQRIRPQELTYLQRPSEKTPKSKITPFRVIYGTQMYDAKYRYLISPLLQPTGSTLFPGADWDTVARQGMQAIVLPFSGQYGFAPTAAFRRINHGVAPTTEALDCLDCHGSASRMPWQELGYDNDPWSDEGEGNKVNEKTGVELNQEQPVILEPIKELAIPLKPSL